MPNDEKQELNLFDPSLRAQGASTSQSSAAESDDGENNLFAPRQRPGVREEPESPKAGGAVRELAQKAEEALAPEDDDNWLISTAKGAGRGILGVGSGIASTVAHPTQIPRMITGSSKQAMEDVSDTAISSAAHGDNPSKAAIYGGALLSSIPVIGPWALQRGKELQERKGSLPASLETGSEALTMSGLGEFGGDMAERIPVVGRVVKPVRAGIRNVNEAVRGIKTPINLPDNAFEGVDATRFPETAEAIPEKRGVQVYRDATRQNVPFAGEEDTESRSAMRLPGEKPAPKSALPKMERPARAEVAAPVKSPAVRTINASGESTASQEAINRARSEKAQGIKVYRIDSRSGNAIPIIGPDRVDAVAGPYDHVVEVKGDEVNTRSSGSKARPLDEKKLLQQISPKPKTESSPEEPEYTAYSKLSPAERRALEYRVGKSSAIDDSPEGIERNRRLMKATNQQLADFANANGPAKLGTVAAGEIEPQWEAADFSRARSGDKGLPPNKQRIFDHIQHRISHAEFLELSKNWGR